MRRLRISWRCLTAAILLLLLAVSCGKDEPDGPRPCRRAILVYAAGFNSLSGNVADDMSEMLAGMNASPDADSCRLMVYRTDYVVGPSLWELRRLSDGRFDWIKLRDYDRSVLSTDVRRMAGVMADFRTETAASRDHGLILWSHASGWTPATVRTGKYWFGDDTSQGADSPQRHMDITDMAEAIPTGLFSFIWADCCHMGGVEVAWQLRHHCERFIAYPTEVLASGVPYDAVLPLLLLPEADIEGAAGTFVDYYDTRSGMYRSATAGVVRSAALEELAAACRRLMNGRGTPSVAGVQRYHREATGLGPYYDLLDLALAYAGGNSEAPAYKDVEKALGRAVTLARTTGRFLELYIDPERYCGLSANAWLDSGSEKDEFYKTLDWYKTVYQ